MNSSNALLEFVNDDPFSRAQIKLAIQNLSPASPKIPMLSRNQLQRQLTYAPTKTNGLQSSRLLLSNLSKPTNAESESVRLLRNCPKGILASYSSLSSYEGQASKLFRRKKKSVSFDHMEHIKIISNLREEKEDLINWTPEGTHRKKASIMMKNFAGKNYGSFASTRGFKNDRGKTFCSTLGGSRFGFDGRGRSDATNCGFGSGVFGARRPPIQKHSLNYECRFPPRRQLYSDYWLLEYDEPQTSTYFHVICLILCCLLICLYKLF
uniref:Uncharacterized protein n=1 Tax=Panagrolaimus sp. PS1159 TaxID=55785 RepID=A0AC35GNN8_9BILA